MQISELEPLVIEWAKEKGLIQHTTEQALAQHGKTDEEVGELLEAIAIYQQRHYEAGLASDPDALSAAQHAMALAEKEIALEAGDVLVTLIIQCAIQTINLELALEVGKEGNYLLGEKGMEQSCGWMKTYITYGSVRSVAYYVAAIAIELEQAIKSYDLTLDECLEAAWHKIKGRKGQTVDGVFVKEGA